MYTQHTSKNQRKLIKEALSFKTQKEAREKGWKLIGEGAFRKAYRKGNIVLKFTKRLPYGEDRDACVREAYFYFKVLRPYQRKNFARIYAWRNDRIIQKYYPQKKLWTIDDEIKVERLINRFNLEDVAAGNDKYDSHNVTIYKGRPICYDMDIESVCLDYWNF